MQETEIFKMHLQMKNTEFCWKCQGMLVKQEVLVIYPLK